MNKTYKFSYSKYNMHKRPIKPLSGRFIAINFQSEDNYDVVVGTSYSNCRIRAASKWSINSLIHFFEYIKDDKLYSRIRFLSRLVHTSVLPGWVSISLNQHQLERCRDIAKQYLTKDGIFVAPDYRKLA